MKIRLGYVAIAKKLGKKITSSSTVTFTNYNKISTSEKKLEKLKAVSASNLKNLGKILNYNIENNIHFYRITSALIPLVTHPEVGYWGHREFLKKDFEYIGKLINESNMRVDTHPDEFNVINSINPKVVENTKINLLRQAQWFEDFKYDLGKMVIHIGGATNGKESGIERFITNFKTFPEEVTSKIIIENDDKTYTAKETLFLCNELKRPMVLDIHHHNCNNANTNIYDLSSSNRINKATLKKNINIKIFLIKIREFLTENLPNITTLNICVGITITDRILKDISSNAAADKEIKDAHSILYNLSDNNKFILLTKKGED